ncbi:Hexokinase [Thelohanellus kitauei]|uniref:Phosphotransferase n=1 Tax=Thelohanellus kitauei TaxID=669202 RepID=A0A0C2J168_THEKT|nr:Hexokinase [Thelohanellus kitauei]
MVFLIAGQYKKIGRTPEKITLDAIISCFKLEKDHLLHIMDSIQSAFNRGLASDADSFLYHPIKMLNTHLMVVPNGSETGRFVALDLGGTNLRILAISVVGGGLSPTSLSFEVPPNIQTGTAEQLFDYIADRIDEGLEKLGFKDVDVEFMGFTFSFPCHQTALNSGELIRWTKGYSATGVEGHDVVAMLRDSCHKKGLKIHDFVLINDTTGTLLSGAFEYNGCTIGVINGTGTNACYLEKITEISKWQGPSTCDSVVINTEWGSFGENGELNRYSTEVDALVDKESINPGRQIFEKMISGMYVGNIVRHVIIIASNNGIIFNGDLPPKMRNVDSFPTSLVSDVYKKHLFLNRFYEIFDYHLDDEQYNSMLKVCDAVSKRAAGLCAAGLSALIVRISTKSCHIAADGSMFRRHTTFLKYVNEYIRQILPEYMDFNIFLVYDGSGKGAALAACVVKENLKTTRSESNLCPSPELPNNQQQYHSQ